MYLSRNWPLFLLFLMFYSCEQDNSKLSSDASDVEKNYFADYEVPEFKWGCIDKAGKVVIEPVYDDLKDMQSGLAAANYEGRWGYIDSLGKKIIDFKYKQAFNFSEDQTFVQDFNNRWLLIRSDGSVLDTLPYSAYEAYIGEYAVVSKGMLKGILDTKGKLVIPIEYESISLCKDRQYIGKKGGQYGVRQISGELIFPFEYDKIYASKNNVYRLNKDKRFFYSDDKGMLDPRDYTKAFDYNYDKTVVKDSEGYKLISLDQKVVKSLPYSSVDYAGEAKWKYQNGEKWGLLDSNGEVLTAANYDLINRYSEGMVACSKGEKWGYLNIDGEEVISFKHPLAWDYHGGLARMIDKRGVGFINKSGKIVIEDIFIEVRDFYNSRARFQTY